MMVMMMMRMTSLPGYVPLPVAVSQLVSSRTLSLARLIGPVGGVCPLLTAISASVYKDKVKGEGGCVCVSLCV